MKIKSERPGKYIEVSLVVPDSVDEIVSKKHGLFWEIIDAKSSLFTTDPDIIDAFVITLRTYP